MKSGVLEKETVFVINLHEKTEGRAVWGGGERSVFDVLGSDMCPYLAPRTKPQVGVCEIPFLGKTISH